MTKIKPPNRTRQSPWKKRSITSICRSRGLVSSPSTWLWKHAIIIQLSFCCRLAQPVCMPRSHRPMPRPFGEDCVIFCVFFSNIEPQCLLAYFSFWMVNVVALLFVPRVPACRSARVCVLYFCCYTTRRVFFPFLFYLLKNNTLKPERFLFRSYFQQRIPKTIFFCSSVRRSMVTNTTISSPHGFPHSLGCCCCSCCVVARMPASFSFDNWELYLINNNNVVQSCQHILATMLLRRVVRLSSDGHESAHIFSLLHLPYLVLFIFFVVVVVEVCLECAIICENVTDVKW